MQILKRAFGLVLIGEFVRIRRKGLEALSRRQTGARRAPPSRPGASAPPPSGPFMPGFDLVPYNDIGALEAKLKVGGG